MKMQEQTLVASRDVTNHLINKLLQVSKTSKIDINYEQIKFLVESSSLSANIVKQALENQKSTEIESFEQSIVVKKNNKKRNNTNTKSFSSENCCESNTADKRILCQQNERSERYRRRNNKKLEPETKSNFESIKQAPTASHCGTSQVKESGKSVFREKAVTNGHEQTKRLQRFDKEVEVIDLEPGLEAVSQEVFNTRTGMVEQAIIVYSKIKTENIKIEEPTENVNKRFTCHICRAFFLREGHLKAHMQIHSGAQCHFSETHKCDQFFRSFKDLQQHKLQHCQFNMDFRRSTKGNRNFKNHTSERRYPCNYCNRAFITRSHLTEHLHIHSNVREFECNVCNKLFFQQRNLRRHMDTHTAKAKVVCTICKKAFSCYSSMNTHKESAHFRIRAKLHPCTICGRDFASDAERREHEMKKSPKVHPCKKCERGFHDRKTLRIHDIRAHTGNFPYLCEFCGHGFTNFSNAKYHVAVKHSDFV